MKNRILDKFGTKAFSLVFAILLWIVIANVDDYKTTKQISGIEIEFVNGNAITEKNKVYEVPDGTSVSVVIKGRRKLVEGLEAKDFKAIADLSKMSLTNAVKVDVSAVSSIVAKELTIEAGNNSVVVAVENKIEKQMPITVRTFSAVAEGYAIRSKTVTPNLITISGAESVIKDVESVVVDADVSGASHMIAMTGSPVFLNKTGDRIDSSKLKYDVKQVDAVIEVLPTKEVAVRMKTKGEPKIGYAISSIDYQPTSIHVVGDAKTLAQLDEIMVDDIDVTECDIDKETSVDIQNYLPDGVTLADENDEIMVKVIIEKVVERSLLVDKDGIAMVGKQTGYKYSIVGELNSFLRIKGLSDDVQRLQVSGLMPTVDVSGLEEGEHFVTIRFKELSNVQYENEIQVKIKVEREE